MNRKQADVGAGVLVATIVFLGVTTAVQVSLGDGGMTSQMDGAPMMAIVGPILMSLVVASVVGGVYVFARGQVFTTDAADESGADGVTDPEDGMAAGDAIESDESARAGSEEATDPATQRHVLDVLRDDERKILEPVIESPGLTQIKLRDRSGFSKSKVSQTITELEERGLLYRERQGRTYRVYPAEDLEDRV